MLKLFRSITVVSLFFLLSLTSASYASETSLEGLTIKKKYPNAWAVVGNIRNLESHTIKGYVKIKFINSNGDITKTSKAYVNGLDPINPDQSGPFKYWTSPGDFSNVSDYQIIFVDM